MCVAYLDGRQRVAEDKDLLAKLYSQDDDQISKTFTKIVLSSFSFLIDSFYLYFKKLVAFMLVMHTNLPFCFYRDIPDESYIV